jgi:PIN domain
MNDILADTHAILWYLFDPTRLSAAALQALTDAEKSGGRIFISAITLVEVRYLVEKGETPDHGLGRPVGDGLRPCAAPRSSHPGWAGGRCLRSHLAHDRSRHAGPDHRGHGHGSRPEARHPRPEDSRRHHHNRVVNARRLRGFARRIPDTSIDWPRRSS